MKVQLEQTVIIRMDPNEVAWLEKHLADPPSSEEIPYDQRKRVELHSALHEALNELNY